MEGMLLRFAGFELDQERATLRRPTGDAIRLRPKTLAMLVVFATRPGRVLSKPDLMDAVWPNVHVGEDSLFQCIREIRTALGDDRRQMIKVVSGTGYLFDAEVSAGPVASAVQEPPRAPDIGGENGAAPSPIRRWRHFALRRRAMVASVGLAIVGLLVLAVTVAPWNLRAASTPSLAVMPIAATEDGGVAAMAATLTARLADGLARIENIRVVAPQSRRPPDYVVSGELRKTERSWEVQARMTRTGTGQVVWSAPISVASDDGDLALQQSRVVAGVGYPLALRINAIINAGTQAAVPAERSSAGRTQVVIEQATAAMTHTSRERFSTARAMLEKALAEDPDDVDLAIALVSVQMRGVQMVWYDPAESAAAQSKAESILKRALRIKPTSIPVLDAYCRFLNAFNEFTESLVVCARALAFNPWHTSALTHIGLAQMQAGRFEEAIASFKLADSFDTPQVSRWTWKLNTGMVYLLMGRSEDALPWLKKSIAITPATGRSHMLLSVAYTGLGRPAEARAAMETGMALRPGSNLSNVLLPSKNASPVFIAATEWIAKAFVAAGLPEH